jgi:hypothetical protein
VGAWVRGCVGAWVRGCVGAWVRGCVGAWARGRARICTAWQSATPRALSGQVIDIGVSSAPLSSGPFESFWTNASHFDFVASHTFPSPDGESGTWSPTRGGPFPAPRLPAVSNTPDAPLLSPPASCAGMNVGFDIQTDPSGVWYLFHRQYAFGARKACVGSRRRVGSLHAPWEISGRLHCDACTG